MRSEHPVRTILKLQKKSESTFADEVKLSSAYISLLLNGRRPLTEELAKTLSEATGVPVIDLYRWDALNYRPSGEVA